MKAKTVIIWAIIITLIMVAIGLILEPRLPNPMAIHWDENGQPNGYGSHFLGLWLVPLMTVGLTLLLLGVPYIDPLKKNIDKFRKEYYTFILFFVFFFFYLHVVSLLYNLGVRINMVSLMIPGFAAFFYYIGVMMGKAKRNYFIGVRTPWTLADDEVWDQTHQIGGKGFQLSAILTLLGVFFPSAAIWVMLIPVMVVSVFTIVYSYVIYRKKHPMNS